MNKVIEALLKSNAHHARLYVDPKTVIRATRILFKGRPDRKKIEFRVTSGPPNFYERNFIKRHGTPKTIQLDNNKC